MANPQLEDGHLRIANEIWEALCRIRIPGEANQTLRFIIRKTYGFRKHWDRISQSQFAKGTKIPESNVSRALKILLKMNLIIKKDVTNGTSYKFNKNYEKWIPLSKKKRGLSNKTSSPYQKRSLVTSNKIDTKDNITKDNIQKTVRRDFKKNPDHHKFVKFWCDEYKKAFGVKYSFMRGKDGQLVKTMLRDFTYEPLTRMAVAFFKIDDQFVNNKTGHTIAAFKAKAQQIAESLNKPQSNTHSDKNVDEFIEAYRAGRRR